MYVVSFAASDKEHDKADKLSCDRGDGSSGDAHMESEYQNRVERDVYNGSGKKADHRVYGASLEAQLIVDDELGHGEGSADKDYPHVDQSVVHRCPAGSKR